MSKFKEMFEKNWACTLLVTLAAVVVGLCVGIVQNRINNPDNMNYALEICRDNIELMYEGARAELVENIDSTMRVYAPSTCMNGLEILRQCEAYGVDIFFVLAQGHLESHFGTKGMAARTNSAFNVYAYDGYDFHKINKNGKYSHPDLSVEPYLKLLKNRYLIGGISETDLMHNYVDVNGNRYASSKEYENNLTNMYQRYITNECLMNAFQKYTKYKILAGR